LIKKNKKIKNEKKFENILYKKIYIYFTKLSERSEIL
ncbi:MAG: hypothetical protein CFH30_00081, partial [Alphaproteobacteria bacterium MarineAlpha8_Bin1]